MTSALSCPSPEKVQDLLANRLSAAEAATLRQHLRDCPVCKERLALTLESPSDRPAPFAFLAPPRAEGELGWLDSFRIVSVLGEGGMAVVFDAEDTGLNRRVALKVLRPDISDPTLRLRFLHEAQLLASLHHENIVSIFQVGEARGNSPNSPGLPYLAMERLEGMTLHEKLKQDRWLPLAEALSLARQAAEGLVVLHENDLVHRDIKPANIWLESRQGQFRRVKLIDFGIARRVNVSQGFTQMGQIVGTLVYMAPEQAAGDKVDGRADLYSLGCMLFHMLTGQPPLGGKKSQTQTLLKEIVRGRTLIVRDKAPQLPGPVAELIQELLSRNPDGRPASAKVVVERLRRLEQEARLDSVPAAPADSAPQIRRVGRRPSALSIWLGGLTLLAAVVVGLVAGWHKLVEPTPLKPTDKSDIKVGILHSLSGDLSGRERPIVHALDLAIEEINKKGGVLGRKIVPIEKDGASDPETFALKAHELIEKNKVEVLFGCWTSASRKRVFPICEERERLLFYSTAYEGLENSPAVVYLGGTPNQTVVPMVRWAFTTRKPRNGDSLRFFLVGSEDVYSRGLLKILEHQIQSEGGTLESASLAVEDTNFAPVVAKIKANRPDIIVNTSNDHGLLPFLKALRGAGIGPPATPTVWCCISENELGSYPIESLKGDYSVACYFGSLDRPQSQDFLKRFRKRFGDVERVNDDMQTAYFAVYLWKAAVEKAGSIDTGAVRRALRGMTVEAPEGPIRIDATTQHADRSAFIGEIVDSKELPQFRIVFRSPRPLPPDPFPSWQTRGQWDRFLIDLYTEWGKHWEKR